jgi:hypothetical protein
MSLTKQQLEALNNNSFPNNNAGAITPDILRQYNTATIDSTVNQDIYTADSASFSERINNVSGSGGNVNTSSLATTGSNEFTGAQTITGSNGTLVYRGTSAGTTDGALASIHANDDSPWLERFYNDSFSSQSSVMSYFAWNDGRFVFHNDSTASIGIGVNGYDNPQVLVYEDSVGIKNDLSVSGTFYPYQIDVSRGGIIQTTGSYVMTYSGSGLVTYDTYQNVATALQPYISGSGGNINTSSFATTGSNSFTGSQTILSGAIGILNNGNSTSLTDTELSIEATQTPAASYIVSFNQTASAAVISYDGATYDNELWTIADSAGIRMTDWNNGTGNLSTVPLISLIANDGSQPAPQFNRGLGVTGSVYVSGGIDTTGKINIHSNYPNGLTIDHKDGGNSLMAYANSGSTYWQTGYITGSDAYQIYNSQTFAVPFSIAQNNNVTFAGNIYANNLTGSTISTGSFITTGSAGQIQTITGSLTISGSNTTDVLIKGRLLISGGKSTQADKAELQLTGFNSGGGDAETIVLNSNGLTNTRSGSTINANSLLACNLLAIIDTKNSGSAVYGAGNVNIYKTTIANDAGGNPPTATFNMGIYDDPDYTTDIELAINVNTGSGIVFSDYDNGSVFDYIPFMSVAPNLGDNPTPTFTRGLTLSPIGAPTSPTPGTMYFSNSDSHFYGWNGSAWKQLDN